MRVDPADPDDRYLQSVDDRLKTVNSDGLTGVGLCGCGVHGATTDVVGAVRDQTNRVIGLVCRGANEEAPWRDLPECGDGYVIWPNMYTVCLDGERYVESVVHEKQRVCRYGDFTKASAHFGHLSRRRILVPQLDRRCAGSYCGAHNVDDRSRCGEGVVGDDDEAQLIGIQVRHRIGCGRNGVARPQAPPRASLCSSFARLCSASV